MVRCDTRINTKAKSCEDPSPVQSPRSVASWPASSVPSSPPDSPRQAEVAPVEPTTTPVDARALAALQQWTGFSALLCQQRADARALATLQQWEQYSAIVCQQRAGAAADNACNPPLSTRQALTCCGPHLTSLFPHCMPLVEHHIPAISLLLPHVHPLSSFHVYTGSTGSITTTGVRHL